MRYRLEILHEGGVSVIDGNIDPNREADLRFWTGVETHQFSGEAVVMGDAATLREFMRVFDGDNCLGFYSAWAGPERCRLVIKH